MLSRSSLSCVVVLSSCVAALVGCSDGKAHITGVVTLDGEPLGGDNISTTVVFNRVGGGARAFGVVGDDGAFVAATGTSKGVEPGEYKITVRGKRIIPNKDPNFPPRSQPLTPNRYARAETSGLTIDADAGSHTLDLALTSN